MTTTANGPAGQGAASSPLTVPVGRSLVAGLVAAVWGIANTLAYASLIFAGSAAAALPLGLSALLAGFAIQAAIILGAGRPPGMAAAGLGGTALVYVAAVQVVDVHLAGQGVPEGVIRSGAAVIACGLITLAAGAALVVFGLLRLGSLVRLLPHPVSGGFFCGLGAAFVLAALGMALGAPPAAAMVFDEDAMARVATCLALGILLVVLPRWTRHWLAMPAVLLGGALLYHAARLALGQDLAAARASGWLPGPFPESGVMLPPVASLALFDAELLLALAPFAASAMLLAAITVAFMVSGLEGVLNRALNLDREMALAGVANMAAGNVGGILGAQGFANTSLLARLGASNRLAASVAPVLALALLAVGPAALGLIPQPVLAALLLAFGIDQMVIRTWRESRRLPWYEVAILLMVAVTMATVGIVEGLGLGLGVALLIFVWTYRKVPVIRGVLRGDEMRSSVTRGGAALRTLQQHAHHILLVRMQGYMFFLNAQSVQRAFAEHAARGARFVILDFQHVLGLDSSAADVFRRLELDAEAHGVALVLSAVRPALAERFARQGVFRSVGCVQVANADRGLEHAEERLLAEVEPAAAEERVTFAAFLSSLGDKPDLLRRLEPFVEPVAFAPGETLMRQGASADDMIFLESGRVTATVQDRGQAGVHLRTLTAGTLVGEIALVRGGHRTASVMAETACEGVRLTRAALQRMETEDCRLALAVNRIIMLQLADKLADNVRAVELALR